MLQENRFSPYIRTLGKGKKGSRSLSFEEACDAFRQILQGEVEDVQLGAFLMLLRVKEESPEEIAGFVKASREIIQQSWLSEPQQNTATLASLNIDVDWSSYAGKRKQYPWFILVLSILAQNGYRCVIHGAQGHTENRLYTETAFTALGLPQANKLSDLQQALDQHSLCFVSISDLNSRLQELIQLRPLFGLRSPVHTLCRLINPFAAKHTFSSIFHPAYADTHQQAARLLEDESMLVFKGESGEVERKSDATCLVKSLQQGICSEEKWPRLQKDKQPEVPEQTVDIIKAVYQGDTQDSYGEQAVIGTLAIVLKQIEKLESQDAANTLAENLWQARDLNWLDQFKAI